MNELIKVIQEEINFLSDKINESKNLNKFEIRYEFSRLNKIRDIYNFFEAQNMIIEHLEKLNYKLKIDKNSLIINWEMED